MLGAGCPARLWPRRVSQEAPAGGVDLVVVAPTPEELRGRAWLGHALERSAAAVAPAGVVYLLVPPRARAHARRILRGHGLAVESAFLHLPNAGESRHVVPLEPTAARQAFAGVAPLVPWKRVAAGALLRVGGGTVMAAAASDVALVARRPRAAPLFAWLRDLDGAPEGRRAVVMTSSWRPSGPRVVLEAFPHGPGGPAVAKLSLDGEQAGEGARLAQVGDSARRAGARVPELLASGDVHGAPALLETRLGGRLAAPLLARRPSRLTPIVTGVVTWLESWQHVTATSARLDRGLLERELLGPAEELAPALEGGSRYLDRLRERCAEAEGTIATVTAAHNDLTMANVLVDGDGDLGVVDWEAAEGAALPLKDFFYAVVDAVAATGRYRDRPGAVKDCFEPGGRHAALGRRQVSVAAAVGAGPEVVSLAFHATWLGHAANEARSAAPSDPRPFLEIAQGLARRG